MIHLKNVQVMAKDEMILNVIDLFLPPSVRLFIVGPSGSGKTTLLKTISGLNDTYSGEILLNHKEIQHPSTPLLHQRGIMLLDQSLGLWSHMSAYEHIAFVLGKGKIVKNNTEAESWLQKVGILHRKNNRPVELSGGEQQRLALARALSAKPKLLLLDEPFSNIDVVLADELMAMIDKEQKEQGFGLVKVTHHFSGVKDPSTQIAVMDKGEIITIESFDKITQQPPNEWSQKWAKLLS